MLTIEKTFWLIAIAMNIFNAYVLRSRSKREIARNPELKAGYDRLIRGYSIYMSLPWLIMGIGIMSGATQGVFDYLNPRAGNPYVISFHVFIIALWAAFIFWIYFRNGAELLASHPGALSGNIKSPLFIKVLAAFMVLCGTLAEIIVVTRTRLVSKPPPEVQRTL